MKDFRQDCRKTINEGRRSGSRKLVCDNWYLLKTSGEDHQQLSPLAIQEVNLICEDIDEKEEKEEEEKILGNNKDDDDAQYSEGTDSDDRESKESAVELETPRNNQKKITA